MHELLEQRIVGLEGYRLVSFLSYRSNARFAKRLLTRRPDILDRLSYFSTPIKEDMDAQLVSTFHSQGLLPEVIRLEFVDHVKRGVVEEIDSSFLDDDDLQKVLTNEERDDLLTLAEAEVLGNVSGHVDRLREDWDGESPPADYFDQFENALTSFTRALSDRIDGERILAAARADIGFAISSMNEEYQPNSSTAAPIAASTPQNTPLANLFPDIDE